MKGPGDFDPPDEWECPHCECTERVPEADCPDPDCNCHQERDYEPPDTYLDPPDAETQAWWDRGTDMYPDKKGWE